MLRIAGCAGTLCVRNCTSIQRQLDEDREAFFGSLIGTLNHIVEGDTIWLQRFAPCAGPAASLQPMATSAFMAEVSEYDLQKVLHYRR